MNSKFIYCQDPNLIALLKKNLTIVCEDANGCYFINDSKNNQIEFDSLDKTKVLYTDSISLEC